MSCNELLELITSTLDDYLAEVEPGDEDTDDMAHAVVRVLEGAGVLK